MLNFKDSKMKSIFPRRELLNLKLNLLKKSQLETRKSELLLIRENIELLLKKKSLNSIKQRSLRIKNGPQSKKNTIKLNMLLKRQNKSLLTPLKPVSSKKAKPLPLLKFLTTSINTPKTDNSRENHGTQSSSYSLKLHHQPPFNPNNLQFRPSLIFAIKSLTRLLKAEKLKEKIINTG